MKMIRPELFLVTSETIEAFAKGDVEATYADMEELGIAHLPYPLVDVKIPGEAFMGGGKKVDWHTLYRFKDEEVIEQVVVYPNYFTLPLESFVKKAKIDADLPSAAKGVRKTLIVMLATKNIVKTRTKDKLVALGIGKNSPYRPLYTTTLSLPTSLTSPSARTSAHKPVRPHLRRGHIRRQPYGPKLQFTKVIWIEPILVNSDDEAFTSSRTSYNTSYSNGVSP